MFERETTKYNDSKSWRTTFSDRPRKAKGSCRGCGIPKSKHSFGAPHKNCEGPEKKSDVEGLRSEVDEMKTSLKAIATAVERLVSPTTSATQQTVKAESSQVVNLDELRKFKCLEDDVDQHIAKLGLNDSSSDSEDSDAPEEPHSTPRSRGQLSAGKAKKLKSGLARKASDIVTNYVLWPHEFLSTIAPSSVELSYLDMNYEQFIAGELEIINAGPINKHEREQRLRHLTDIAKDATVYPWPTVRNYHKTVLQQIERGQLRWTDDFDELHTRFLRKNPVSLPSYTTPNKPRESRNRPRYCGAFQSKKCTQTHDHFVDGTLEKHVCGPCFRIRNIEERHAAVDCPQRPTKQATNETSA
ncbi:hypothetical protein QZH41_003227 [Actinostola sp. cb2023]|nr:hypothetical protein QZH41_003227 [Actinostola sp. cb2023]